jgi:hypothetical protein
MIIIHHSFFFLFLFQPLIVKCVKVVMGTSEVAVQVVDCGSSDGCSTNASGVECCGVQWG